MFLSIIVPIYNTPIEKLERCFASIKYSAEIETEIIAVDDGSEPYVGSFLREYAIKDKRVKYVYQKNGGVSAARNKGIQAAEGTYIMFVDSDDTAIPYSVELGDFAEEADIIFYDMVIKEKKGEYVSKSFSVNGSEVTNKIVLATAIISNRISGPYKKIFRNSFLKQNSCYFNTNMVEGEDIEFGLRTIMAAEKMIYIDRNIYCYWHTFSSEKKRLRMQPDKIVHNSCAIHRLKKEILLESGDYNADEKRYLLTCLESSYINTLFNIWTSLYVLGILNEALKKFILDELKEIVIPEEKYVGKKIKIKRYLLTHHCWKTIQFLALLRNVYLDLFAKIRY